MAARIICISINVNEAVIFDGRSNFGCVECWARWLNGGDIRPPGASHIRLFAAPWSEAFRQGVLSAVVDTIAGSYATLHSVGARVMRSDFRQWSRYHVAIHPRCSKCVPNANKSPDLYARLTGNFPIMTGPDLREKSLGSLHSTLEDTFVGERFSLVRGITHDTQSHLFAMAFARFSLDDDFTKTEVGVGRTGRLTLDRSVAIVEAVERFCGFRPRHGRPLIRASRLDLGEMALDPRALILHSPSQAHEAAFNLVPYDDALVFDWVWGFSMKSRTSKAGSGASCVLQTARIEVSTSQSIRL